MKKILFCVLMISACVAFGMSQERQEREKGLPLRKVGWRLTSFFLEELYGRREAENQDEQKGERESAREKLARITREIDRTVPGVQTYLDFLGLVIETDPRHSCLPDPQGVMPIQRLLGLEMLPSEAGEFNAIKKRVKTNWLLQVRDWYRDQGQESQEAYQAELRYRLTLKPLPSQIIDSAHGVDLDAYRSPEGHSFYQQIEDMHASRDMNDKTYSFLWDPELWTKQKWKPTEDQMQMVRVVAAYLNRAREAAQG